MNCLRLPLLLLAPLTLAVSALPAETDSSWTLKSGERIDGELFGYYAGAAFFTAKRGQTYFIPREGLSGPSQSRLDAWSSAWAEARRAGPRKVGESDSKLSRFLVGKLVAWEGDDLQPYDLEGKNEPDFYAFYFSAHWCGPCRRFTPELRVFYHYMRASGFDNFEIVFVSNDTSSKMMKAYMKEEAMPWPALEYGKRNSGMISKYSGTGIPCLVVTDRAGRLLFHSYSGSEYLGPDRPKLQLEATLRWLRALDASLVAADEA